MWAAGAGAYPACVAGIPKPRLTQQAPEGDGRRQGGEVDEDDSSQALGVERVPKVAQVVGIAAPHISDQAPEGPARPPEGIVFHCICHLYHLQERCNPGLRQGTRHDTRHGPSVLGPSTMLTRTTQPPAPAGGGSRLPGPYPSPVLTWAPVQPQGATAGPALPAS